MWTWNWRRVTTGRALWRQKPQRASRLYARSEDASRLRRVLDEREITAGILTL